MQGFWDGFEKRAAIAAGGDDGLVTQYIHKFPLRNEEEKSKYRRASAAAGGLVGGILSMPLGALIGTAIHGAKSGPFVKGEGKAALKGSAIAALLGGALGGGLEGYQAMRESNKGYGITHSTHSLEDAKLKADKYHKPFFKTIMGMGDKD